MLGAKLRSPLLTAGLLIVCISLVPANGQVRALSAEGNRRVTAVAGQILPHATAENDRGAVDTSFPLNSMRLYFQFSPAQSRALEQLLADQQNPASPRYHQWLTPEQFGQSFGPSENDYMQVAAWLKSEGFAVEPPARSRRWISFRGTAGQVERSFQTAIHRFQVKGEQHYANTRNPVVPSEFSDLVAHIRGLHDVRLAHRAIKARPRFNFPDGSHGTSPDDFAIIYNVNSLYGEGIDGAGQKIVVVGQSAPIPSDLQQFRAKFNLPAQTIQQVLVPGQSNPGVVPGDIVETNLDLQWAGAVARKATLIYVYAPDVLTATEYAVDQNLAPVLSSSYGLCEAYDLIDLPLMQSIAQQANALGITWLNASGDVGAADCEDLSAKIAQTGLAVDAPASIPEVTGVGGTQFQIGNFWATTSNANGASALGYVPEVGWNSTGIYSDYLSAGGGGTSLLFPKPIWQTGPGVPAEAFRHVPDVSLNSSDVTPYLVISEGQEDYYYGTSAATPTFAGIVSLLNQRLVSSGIQQKPGLGNINPALYRLAEARPSVFHDITSGDNAVPCAAGSADCVAGRVGFSAGVGYDRATGLGSVDAFALVHQWADAPAQISAVVPSVDQIPVFSDASGSSWQFKLRLSEEAGIATRLTGLTIDGRSFDPAAVFGTTSIPARGSINSGAIRLSQVAVPKNVVFRFTGTDLGGRTWSQDYVIPFRGPQLPITAAGSSNAASGQQAYAPGMILSIYGDQFAEAVQAASVIPLPSILAKFEAFVNGVPAPLYYVSPKQVNIQIPYETGRGPAEVVVGNPYQSHSFTIQIGDAAPGIFAANGFTVPFSSVKRGGTTTLFITGEGQVQPSLSTGATPDPATPFTQLPKPQLASRLTVGGQPATIAFIGIPSGLAGVTQINFTVPPNAPLGVQPVVVTIGTASSPPVNIEVTQ